MIATPSTKASALSYAAKGWRIIPIYGIQNGVCECPKGAQCRAPGKHPRLKEWETICTTDVERVTGWFNRWPKSNVGIAFGQGIIDIELDTKGGKNGPATLEALEKRLGKLPTTYTWRSGGGGLHRVFRTKATLRGGIEALGDGVDVLSDGRQAVAPPSRHASGKHYVIVQDVPPALLPDAWVNELRSRDASLAGGDASGFDLLDRDPTATIEEAEALLAVVPADDYSLWLKIGMALKHQWTDTDKEEAARDVWARWASKSDKYDADETDARWAGFNGGSAGWVTFGSIRWASKEYGGKSRILRERPPEDVVEDSQRVKKVLYGAMNAATNMIELREAAKGARAVELTRDDHDDVVRVLRKRAKAFDEPINKQEAEALVAYDRRGWFLERAKTLAWGDTLYLQLGAKAAILEHADIMVEHGRESFNSAYGYRLAAGTTSAAGGKVDPLAEPWTVACNLTQDDGAPLLPRVHGWGYKPGAGRVFTGPTADLLANSWHAWDKGTAPMLWSDQEADDVEAWRSHLKWMLGPSSAATLEQFLAWTVQNPQQRVRWCFTVLGPEGNGKSLVMHCLMKAVVGQKNVSVVGPADLATPQYNAWSNAGAVGCIDELHVDSDTSKEFAVVNALKPALTDDVLRVSDKYRKAVVVDNVTSWYATSNFMVPFRLQGDTGRRWFFARCVHNNVKAISDSLGGPLARREYFTRLATAARRSSAALRGWLSSVSLVGFDPQHAPVCSHMDAMLEASADPVTLLIRRTLENPTNLVNLEVIGMKPLLERLAAAEMSERITERVVAKKLLDAGYRIALRNEDPWRSKARTAGLRTTWYVATGEEGGAQRVRDLVFAFSLS
jgi:hypothetical protein